MFSSFFSLTCIRAFSTRVIFLLNAEPGDSELIRFRLYVRSLNAVFCVCSSLRFSALPLKSLAADMKIARKAIAAASTISISKLACPLLRAIDWS